MSCSNQIICYTSPHLSLHVPFFFLSLTSNRFSNTFHNCSNVYGEPFCPNNVSGYMYQTYMGCTNITGKAACGDQITNMYSAYENCTSLEEAACGFNVLDNQVSK